MRSIQETFDRIREIRKEQKELKEMYKDALVQADKYEEIVEQIKELREEKKQVEARIQAEMGKAYEKLEDLKHEMESEKEMMNDIAISTLMKGETVMVTDEYQNSYEPQYSVKFKKADYGKTTE